MRTLTVSTRRMLPALLLIVLGLARMNSPAAAQDSLKMVCAPAAEWCEAIAAGFTRETGIKVAMIRKSTGEILAQVRAEKANPRLDVWFGGATDGHFVAAEEGLLQPYASPNMAALYPWARRAHDQSKGHCVGVSSGTIAIAFNKEWLAKKKIAAPQSWADLLKPEFKGEVQISNPNSSGTAYTTIAGLIQLMGEEPAFAYLKKLHAQVNSYTRSGAAPVKAVGRGETAIGISFAMEMASDIQAGFPIGYVSPAEGTSYEVACMSIVAGARNPEAARRFYDWYLTPAAMAIAAKTNQWHFPAHTKAELDPRIPDITRVKLVDYDFAKYGGAAERKRILDRWEREIAAAPK